MNVAFYSYKGGVGRTQLVANLASYLYLYENKKVLLMDWDLEAPGLHFYFKNPKEDRNFQNSDFKANGLMEMLQEYVRMVRSKNPDEIKKEDLPRLKPENIVSIAENTETGAKIDIVPAGIYENFIAYRRKVIDFNWLEFYEMLDGIRYLEFVIKPQLKELGYDFVFIDSRTGFSDYQNICNIQMADANIIVIAANMQNLEGCVEVAQSIIDSPYIKERRREPIVFPILSRVETLSEDFTKFYEVFMAKTQFMLEETKKYLAPNSIYNDEYYTKTIIPYNRFIAIGEHLVFKEKQNTLNEFQQRFKYIANYLLPSSEPMNQDRSIKRNDIFISYSHHKEDAPYFDEIKRQLASLKSYGLNVHVWDDTQIRAGDDWLYEIKRALSKTKVGILLVSPNFLASRFIGDKEIPALLQTVQASGGRIMSLILRKTLFSMHPTLGKYQSVNSPQKPLNALTEPEKDEVYAKLLEDILHFYKE